MFFINKYFEDFDNFNYFKNILECFRNGDSYDLNHNLIIYGNDNYYKMYILNKLVGKIYGEKNVIIKNVNYFISGYNNTKINISIKQSKNHIIIEPTSNSLDKYVIQEILNEYINSKTLNIINNNKIYKIIVINKIDDLSLQIQSSIRRIMEKYNSTCKFILLSNQLSKINIHIKSRCIQYKMPILTTKNILEIIIYISINEKINLTCESLSLILKNYDNKLNKALWLLEIYKYTNIKKNTIDVYNNVIKNIGDILLTIENKNIEESLIYIRDNFYLLFITNIPVYNVIILITMYIIKKIKNPILIYKFIDIVSKSNIKCIKGTRLVFQFEAFIINVMKLMIHK